MTTPDNILPPLNQIEKSLEQLAQADLLKHIEAYTNKYALIIPLNGKSKDQLLATVHKLLK